MLVVLYAFFVGSFISVLIAIFEPAILPFVLILYLVKTLAEFVVLARGNSFFHQKISLFHFLIAAILHVPYIVFAGALGQFTPLRWKGRTLRT